MGIDIGFTDESLKNCKDVKLISLWFTDILGFLKSFDITPKELKAALVDSVGFDGSPIEGFARIEERDMLDDLSPTKVLTG